MLHMNLDMIKPRNEIVISREGKKVLSGTCRFHWIPSGVWMFFFFRKKEDDEVLTSPEREKPSTRRPDCGLRPRERERVVRCLRPPSFLRIQSVVPGWFFLAPTNQREREMALKAVTLTHVRYHKGDQLGHFLAWISLIPVFISLGGFVSHFIFRRELQAIFFAVGLTISQFLNELIKKSVQQSRPETCFALEACDSHGWPSSHSQYMFFFAIYFTLLRIGRLRHVYNVVAVAIPWPLAILTMYSRVYLGYHTVAQVFAGAALGLTLGAIWFWVVNTVLVEYYPAIEESPIGRFLYIKDTTHIQDVLKFEYDNARAARNTIKRKQSVD